MNLKNQNILAKLHLWCILDKSECCCCHLAQGNFSLCILMLENTSVIYAQWNCTSSLLNSHNDLLASIWSILRYFDFLLTSKCGDHLILSGQSQKLIELLGLLLKNFLRSFNMAIDCRWIIVLKIYLVAGIAFVITMMQLTSYKCVAWLIPHLIVKSSALVELTLVVWWTVLVIIS